MNRYDAVGMTQRQADAELDERGRDRTFKFYEGWWFRFRKLDDHQVVRLLSAMGDCAWHGVYPDFSDDPVLDYAFDEMSKAARRDWRQVAEKRYRGDAARAKKGRRNASEHKTVGETSLEEAMSPLTGETSAGAAGASGEAPRPGYGLVPGGSKLVPDEGD